VKVKANKFYVYIPCLLDQVDGRTDLKSGDVVQVRNLDGCPPCNTMRHAHVFDDAGKFAGLVATSSLVAPVYKNVAYFPDQESADALVGRLVAKHPDARTVAYTRGFAVQYRISGPYYPELENVASPMLQDLIDRKIGATDAPATCPEASGCNPDSFANSGRPRITGASETRWPRTRRPPNSQQYRGEVELSDGSRKVRTRTLFWSTSRGKSRAVNNYLKYLQRMFPDWRRVEVDPIGPDCHRI
jgi:hypothetical protein